MVSNEHVICPFCKKEHDKHKVIGASGLINCNGYERSIICDKCGKEFTCVCEIKIKFKTSK